jgi:hypothetical protein
MRKYGYCAPRHRKKPHLDLTSLDLAKPQIRHTLVGERALETRRRLQQTSSHEVTHLAVGEDEVSRT